MFTPNKQQRSRRRFQVPPVPLFIEVEPRKETPVYVSTKGNSDYERKARGERPQPSSARLPETEAAIRPWQQPDPSRSVTCPFYSFQWDDPVCSIGPNVPNDQSKKPSLVSLLYGEEDDGVDPDGDVHMSAESPRGAKTQEQSRFTDVGDSEDISLQPYV
jgi:hypothetical protein